MKIIRQNWCYVGTVEGNSLLQNIELAGRLCYKSEDKITPDTARTFVKKAINIGHHSIIEHGAISVRIITDRGVTHELVRHRLASYSQESTRYYSYSNDRFGNEITVILPVWFEDIDETVVNTSRLNNTGVTELEKQFCLWRNACRESENKYFALLDAGQSAQEARSVLPNSLKTEIIMTANPREWRHVFSLRTSAKAHPQIRLLMMACFQHLSPIFPYCLTIYMRKLLRISMEKVNHPSHYNQGKLEVIDVIEDADLGFHLGNVVKYILRAEHKGNMLEDLKKAKWYLDRKINNYETL